MRISYFTDRTGKDQEWKVLKTQVLFEQTFSITWLSMKLSKETNNNNIYSTGYTTYFEHSKIESKVCLSFHLLLLQYLLSTISCNVSEGERWDMDLSEWSHAPSNYSGKL